MGTVENGQDARRRRAMSGLLAFGMLAAVVAACGDDGSAALSKEEFVEQADAICAATTERADPIFEEFYATAFADMPDGPTIEAENQMVVEGFDGVLDEVTPLYEAQVDDIRALAAPDGDAELVGDLLADFDSALAEMNELTDAAVDGDPTAIDALTAEDAQDPFADVNARARSYGLAVCGEEDA